MTRKREMTKNLLTTIALLAAPLLAVVAQPAFATPTTYSESISNIHSSVSGQPSFSGLASFINQSLATPYTETPFFIGAPAGSGSGTETSTVTVTLGFSDSAGGSGSLTETGAFSANYSNTTDWIIWTGETVGTRRFYNERHLVGRRDDPAATRRCERLEHPTKREVYPVGRTASA